jgi:uncharacterized membrane protein YoaK (UPF0700 family)
VNGLAKGEALLLSGVAGAVDGVGYVLLHVFTAHITGNTVHVGTGLGRLELGAAWRPAVAIASFVAGVAAGALVRDACGRHAVPARPAVLGLTGLLLSVFLGVGLATERAWSAAPRFTLLAALAALAMGCQNAVMPRVGGRRVRTYITGTMTELGEVLVAAGQAGAGAERAASLRRAGELFAVWLAYLAGGIASGVAGTWWGVGAVLLPIAGLAIAVVLELRSGRSEDALGSRATA